MAAVTSQSPTLDAPAAPRRSGWVRLVAWLAWAAALLVIVLGLAWAILQWGILPNLERWRAPIEQHASRALGVPVNIGAIRVQTTGLVPTVVLDDVVLRDASKREALRLQRVTATLSPQSVFNWRPHLQQLVIEGAALDVRRDTQGRIHVAGIDINRPRPGVDEAADGSPANWLFEQNEVAVRGAAIRWTDERRSAPPLALSAVDLLIRNAGGTHALKLAATPPASWGERFSIEGSFTQPRLVPGTLGTGGFTAAGDWSTWSGAATTNWPRIDVAQLRQYVNLPFEVTSGRGSLKTWLEVVQGSLVGAKADVSLSDVDVRLAQDLAPLDIQSLQGRLVAKRTPAGGESDTTLAFEGVTFTTKDGQSWPRGDVRVLLRGSPRQPTGGELHAQGIDLSVLSLVATRLPLAANIRSLLAQIKPQGHADAFMATWDGPLDALKGWRMRASTQNLVLSANPVPLAANTQDQTLGRPGIQGGTVSFDATHEGGEGTVEVAKGSLTFPGVFEQPKVELQQLKAQLQWTVRASSVVGAPPDIVVKAKSVQFANTDAQGTFDGAWRSGPGTGFGAGKRYPGAIEINGKLTRGRAVAVNRYLPLGLGPDVRRYVANAFSDGHINSAAFAVKGDMWAFPYRNQNGIFRLVSQFEGVRMNIAPDALGPKQQPIWPVFSDVAGELTFDRTSMQIRGATGRLGGVQLLDVNGEVADFANQPTVAIKGTARGPLTDMLGFLEASPVGGWIGNALAQATATGHGEVKLGLQVPLRALETATVQGTVLLTGNDLRIQPGVPLLGNARGSIEFTEKSLNISPATATVFGGAAAFEGGMQGGGALQIKGTGVITAEGFAAATELGAITKLGAVMKGQAPYQLALNFFGAQPEFVLTSTLQGMAVQAPAPLGKAADALAPLRVATQLVAAQRSDKASATRDVLRIDAGALFQAHYVRDITGDSPRVIAGGIGVGDHAPQPDAGVHAIVKAEMLDADAWQAFGERLGLSLGPSAAPPGQVKAAAAALPGSLSAVTPRAPSSVAKTEAAQPVSVDYSPTAIALTSKALVVGGRRMTQVTAGLTQQAADGTWRANVDAEQLSGYVQWRPATAAQPPHLQARLARLSVPAAATDSVEALLTDDAPADPPSLDIVVEAFELRGRKLGRVEIEALHESTAGAAHVWRLNRLHIINPEAQFKGTGVWQAAANGAKTRRMVMDFTLALEDSGEHLARFGLNNVIRGGQGLMTGQVSWAGSPLSWHAPSLSGAINLKLNSGQFLKVNAGAARLLGVLSLQSLPRRLLLDFRDVFADGFAFDNITGDVTLVRGQATTKNLRMRGVQAAVMMEGRADIVRETQDINVWVVPEINAGAASLVYAAVNPAVGLGTFFAQLFLRKPLMEATTRKFHVHGSWADPQVDRIERPPGDRIPDSYTDAEPSSALDPAPAAPAPDSPVAASQPGASRPTRPHPPANPTVMLEP